MSTLSNLLRQVEQKDAALADDIRDHIKALAQRREFGLNFERHIPETVTLPGRPIRKGDKVRFLAPRGDASGSVDQRLWRVVSISRVDDARVAFLARKLRQDSDEVETTSRTCDDLAVVAEFRDPIYPGLVSTEKVEHGGDKPFHTVISAENFHALQSLLYTHEGKVDAIYIDPPYNTGARDWKYNNDYVDGDDIYRHSKWLAFMERRLKLAKRLLRPEDSVLIVTIDEKEYLRLGMLLEQTFTGARMQMISSVINPAGAGRATEFSRTDEYIYFVRIGNSAVLPEQRSEERRPVTWDTLRRSDFASRRGTAKGGTSQFYPIYVDPKARAIESIGEPLPHDLPRERAPERDGCVAVFPIRPDGTEMNWGLTPDTARERLAAGYLRVGKNSPTEPQEYVISYLTGGIVRDIYDGKVAVSGRAKGGSVIAHYVVGRRVMPTTQWNRPSHDAQRYGTELLKAFTADRRFPFPKSLYAVEDCLGHFIADKPDAVIVDFFAGSGTTAHAVMRLNRRDGGRRSSLLVTNNEVSAGEQEGLRAKGLRPGDPDWEALGICEYNTKPRLRAAVTGITPEGNPVEGAYTFRGESPMSDGFKENVEFFTMTYQAPRAVAHNRSFEAVAALVWLRAGAQGARVEKAADDFALAETYGVLFDLDASQDFVRALADAERVRMASIVTDDDRPFQMICSELPSHVEPVRLYESYLTNFMINTGRE